jgi:flagellar basal-body rod protein FlgB
MGLFKELKPIEEGALYYAERAKVIQSNIANADTPFYEPKELLFQKELEKSLKLKKSNPKHIDPYQKGKTTFKEVTLKDVSGYDNNRVNLDKELAKLAETAVMARTLNEIIKKEIGKLKLAIGGR